MEFYCVGDEDAVRGFRLAGAPGRAVTDGAGVEAALAAAAAADCRVVIITRAAAGLARAAVDRLRAERSRPLIVEI